MLLFCLTQQVCTTSTSNSLTLVNEEFHQCCIDHYKLVHWIYNTVSKSEKKILCCLQLRCVALDTRPQIVVNSITKLNLRALLEVYATRYKKHDRVFS